LNPNEEEEAEEVEETEAGEDHGQLE